MSDKTSPYFVAVDLGSNSFHMLVAREKEGSVEIVDRVKDMVQIARGLGPDGNLSLEAQQRALDCLVCFSERIRKIPQYRVRAVGTKALRAAQNAAHFLNLAEGALGHPIRIISGYEEARLVYLGVSHSISHDQRKRLVIDIGGGSTEFIIGHDYSPQHLESLSIGCVTYAERYLKEVNEYTMRTAYLAASEELELIRSEYMTSGWDIAFGASGTMRVIAQLMPQQTGGAVITRDHLQTLVKQAINDGEVSASGISQLRKDVLPAGLAILMAIFEQLNLQELHVADATLKEGLIYDSLGRLSQRDTRDQTVENLCNRYQVDLAQAARVRDTALYFWSQLTAHPSADSLEKVLLWAALLHEIGLSISHSGHHKHGYYLLKNSDLGGFSRYEQHLLARVVKLHRRKLNPEDLNPENSPELLNLVICLRLAVLLHRGREALCSRPSIDIRGNTISLGFSADWLEHHPLTERSLNREATYLEALDLSLKF